MSEFRLDPTVDTARTHGLGEVDLIPNRVVKRFGPPRECDGYKVSGTWSFVDAYGSPYTLYDWKCTSLYFDVVDELGEPALPTPQEFWALETPQTLSIGGRSQNDGEEFKAWLSRESG
jgi:hypothetical protein